MAVSAFYCFGGWKRGICKRFVHSYLIRSLCEAYVVHVLLPRAVRKFQNNQTSNETKHVRTDMSIWVGMRDGKYIFHFFVFVIGTSAWCLLPWKFTVAHIDKNYMATSVDYTTNFYQTSLIELWFVCSRINCTVCIIKSLIFFIYFNSSQYQSSPVPNLKNTFELLRMPDIIPVILAGFYFNVVRSILELSRNEF